MINHIFIVSTGRTGTHSLAHTLNRMPGICATHERFAGARDISNRLWDDDIAVDTARELVRNQLKFHSNHCGDSVWIDSNCLLWNFIDLLDEACEGQAGYIYVYRNAKSTIDSMFATAFYRTYESVSWVRRAHRGFHDITLPDYTDEKRYENCEYGYKIRTKQIETALDAIPAERQLRCSFKDMVADPSKMCHICNFIQERTGVEIKRVPKLLHSHKRPAKQFLPGPRRKVRNLLNKIL